ncbi:sensor histidine kinase [Rubellimicrobium arenae]|uniref:sensor histidine kinase n=1 Tax=Rubellimicrobium arenae TaxID=2817372 RepID=UPI001B30B57D|nr:HAMP domain-containing sensor histidine kinase [Rubellimicrobium arenae]
MSSWSIRLRLLLAGAAAVSLALVLSTWGLAVMFNRHVERVALNDLNDRLERLLTAVEWTDAGQPVLEEPPRDPLYQRPYSGHYWQIQMDGEPLRSRSLWDYALPLPALDGQESWQGDLPGPDGQPLLTLDRRIRVERRGGDRPLRVTVAVDRADIDRARSDFLADLAPYTALLAVVLIAGGALQVTVGLRPLSTLGDRVAALNSGQARRIGTDVPAEVLPLAEEIDTLIDGQEHEIERARQRAADLAHGLKTPLQALVGEATRLRAAGAGDAAEGIEEIVRTMQVHVDRELARARLRLDSRSASSDPRSVAESVVAVLRRTPRGRELDYRVEGPTGLSVRLDRADLTEALGALVENATRHARHRVVVTCEPAGARTSIRVRDDGTGTDPAQLDRLRDRGVRLDETAQGTGLGLAIASEITEAVGGELHLRNRDRGFEAELLLPARA